MLHTLCAYIMPTVVCKSWPEKYCIMGISFGSRIYTLYVAIVCHDKVDMRQTQRHDGMYTVTVGLQTRRLTWYAFTNA